MSKPLVYLVLGPANSGRRAILSDLLSNGLDDDDRPALLISPGESATSPEVQKRFEGVSNLISGMWSIDRSLGRLEAAVPEGATHVFFLSEGHSDPVEQVEALHAWLQETGAEMARVITVVNCKLGYEHPELKRWYDACIHFSDVVLLNRREGVPNQWMNEFSSRFKKQHIPCLLEFVKNDEVRNPALILEPQARRISMLFDDEEAWAMFDDDEADDSEDDDAPDREDPYLQKLATGRRVKEIPDIAKFLGLADD